MCGRGADQKRRRLDANADWVASGMEFQDHKKILENMDTFKYIGRMLSFDDINCNDIVRNLHIVRRKWERFSRLFGWEGDDSRTYGRFYVSVVQYVLIFGSES